MEPYKTKKRREPPVPNHFTKETSKGNRPGSTFKKDGWRNILESLNKRLGFNIDRKQLKNHWDSTRSKWKAWSKLICTDFMKWVPTTCQFGANEEEWASYIQLEIIFSGVAGQGEAEVSERPTQHRKHDKNILITNLSDVEPKDVKPERIEPLCEAVESRPQNEHPDKGEHQLDAVESRSAVTVQSIQGERSYSIGECIECLDGMLESESQRTILSGFKN
ncbi:L10-interacting MYB domain-containing protein [Drosera capensis]